MDTLSEIAVYESKKIVCRKMKKDFPSETTLVGRCFNIVAIVLYIFLYDQYKCIDFKNSKLFDSLYTQNTFQTVTKEHSSKKEPIFFFTSMRCKNKKKYY